MKQTQTFTYKHLIEHVKMFIELGDWSEPTKYQIRSLWTTYCLWYDLQVDTYSYDVKLFELYNAIVLKLNCKIDNIEELKTTDNFEMFMCEHLI